MRTLLTFALMLSPVALAVLSQPTVFDLIVDHLAACHAAVIFASTPAFDEYSCGTGDRIVLIGPIFSLAPLAAFC